MIFDIQYQDPKVYDGYAIANEIIQGPELAERIEDLVKLTYTHFKPVDVSEILRDHIEMMASGRAPRVPVKQYYYPSKNVIATTFKDEFAIYVNSKNVPYKTVRTYLENGAHEFAHKPLGFGHGSNYTQDTRWGRMMCRINGDREDKSFSVPAVFERLVYEIAKEKRMIK